MIGTLRRRLGDYRALSMLCLGLIVISVDSFGISLAYLAGWAYVLATPEIKPQLDHPSEASDSGDGYPSDRG